MRCVNAVFLMSDTSGHRACNLARQAGIEFDAVTVNDLNSLEDAFSINRNLLISFGTGVIVPSWILEIPSLVAVNIHSASPQFPGRDPHHFAVYEGVAQYGATIHYMSQNVDDGPIIDVELFDVPTGITPSTLLDLSNQAAWRLIHKFLLNYQAQGAPSPLDDLEWGSLKTTRKMFIEMCRIDLTMPQEEIARRYRATSMPGYRNLYVDIQGYRFRIEDRID